MQRLPHHRKNVMKLIGKILGAAPCGFFRVRVLTLRSLDSTPC